MSETTTQPGAASGTPEPAPAPAPVPTVPAGYVPEAELTRERERARGFQSEADRLKGELARVQTPAPAPATTQSESQPADILGAVKGAVSEAVATVLRVGEMRDASVELKAQFPHADPSYFTKEKLAQFDSPESLRAAVEADHKRVAEILKAHGVTVAEEKRDELAAEAAGAAGPTTGTTPAAGGDPTLEQLNGMTLDQLNALEREKPGVVTRVMGAAR